MQQFLATKKALRRCSQDYLLKVTDDIGRRQTFKYGDRCDQ
ncbi:hypothetical protein OK016_13560 [Vibrio chagasii]|nr:hypothetical protein [Vibrio chagasii]